MNTPIWKSIALMGLLFAALVLGTLGRITWHEAFIEGRTFTGVRFIDWLALATWAFEFLLFFIFGLVLGAFYRFSRPLLMSLAFGLFCGGVRLFWTRHSFPPETEWSTYFWSYGIYLIPAVSAVAGAALWCKVTSTSAAPLVAARR